MHPQNFCKVTMRTVLFEEIILIIIIIIIMLIMTKVYFLFIDQDLNTRIKSLIPPVQIQRKSEH